MCEGAIQLVSYIPGPDDDFDTNDVRSNVCVTPMDHADGYYPYTTMVLEGGHALGLSGFSAFHLIPSRASYEMSHPTIYDSVMNYDENLRGYLDGVDAVIFNEPDCSPNPFDVMAIYALYQTLP